MAHRTISEEMYIFYLCMALLSFRALDGMQTIDFSKLSLRNIRTDKDMLLFNEYSSNDADTYFGKMKFLNFSGTVTLFVGGRNAISQLDLNLTLTNKTDKNDSLWKFEPVYNKTYIPGKYLINEGAYTKDARATLDGCLSFSERIRASDSYKSDPTAAYWTYPGAGLRMETPWIRFTEQFENFVCRGSFVRGLEKVVDPVDGKEALWACGTFGSFPRAFLLDPHTLEVKNASVDSSLASCARWPDEPMATRIENNELYVASGWGLYRPDGTRPDVAGNNSTMLYSDWRMLASGHHWFARMAMVLGQNVAFLPRVAEDGSYLYFFGRETSTQLSHVNSFSNEVQQSFMLRICKNDVGYRYTADEDWLEISRSKHRGNFSNFRGLFTDDSAKNLSLDLTSFSYSPEAYNDTYQLPTKHFASARKFPFGCYLKRYDGAQSLNRFWGEQNIKYFNRVADVDISFDWIDSRGPWQDKTPKFFREYHRFYSYDIQSNIFDPNTDMWHRMYGAFSSTGQRQRRSWRRQSRFGEGAALPHGAICQFEVSEWKTDSQVENRNPPRNLYTSENALPPDNKDYPNFRAALPKNKRQFNKYSMNIERAINPGNISIQRQYEEFLAYYGGHMSDFYSRISRWFQGAQAPGYEGLDLHAIYNFTNKEQPLWDAAESGRCLDERKMRSLTKEKFLSRMRTASTTWPTDWDSWTSKAWDAVFHTNPMQVAGDNASFVAEGVEFAKMFVLAKNFSKYNGGDATRPLVYLLLVTTEAEVYRVVMCDLVSHSIRFCTCEVTNTDQPFVTKFFGYMRGQFPIYYNSEGSKVEDEKRTQMRVSSLLSVWNLADTDDEEVYPHDEDWQAPLLKDAEYRVPEQRLYVATARRLMSVSLKASSVCASYRRSCVHCASDPLCAWQKKTKKCVVYNSSRSGDDIQDVLHRGEACHEEIKNVTTAEDREWRHKDGGLRLTCPQAEFYRGIISWRVNGTVVDLRNSLHRKRYIVNAVHHFLILQVSVSRQLPLTVTCVGTSMDDDKKSTVLAKYSISGEETPISSYCRKVNEQCRKLANSLQCVKSGKCKIEGGG